MSAEEMFQQRSLKNALNAMLMVGVIIPPALVIARLQSACPSNAQAAREPSMGLTWLRLSPALFSSGNVCELYTSHPLLFVNLLYLIVVDIGFYIIYVIQASTWLIDPHWQLIPICIALFWFTHPDSQSGTHPRAWVTMLLMLLWAVRLLHNYFRREGWNFGLREDWRYADMREAHGKLWLVTQFFTVSLAQHGMLVGLTMPLQPAMASNGTPLNFLDVMAVFFCLAGITIGMFADNQLWEYMRRPNKPLVLQTGLWSCSRHPNHLGEQCWWLGLLMLGVAAEGRWWPICFGVMFNHPLDTFVTLPLIEERMLRRSERAQAYRDYQLETPLLWPFLRWPRAVAAKKTW